MSVSLPQSAKDPAARKAQLEASRRDYEYDYTWPPGVAVAKNVPLRDEFTPPYVAKVGELNARLMANQAAIDLDSLEKDAHSEMARAFTAALKTLTPHNLHKRMFDAAENGSSYFPNHKPTTMEESLKYFALTPRPPIVDLLVAQPEKADEVFAWQRIAGANPMVINCVSRLPDAFPVTEAHYSRAVGNGDTLAAAAAEGRLFLADYTLLDSVYPGQDEGRQKTLRGPYALFAQSGGKFRAVAIQLGPKPGPDTPVLTPADGWPWKTACHFVQVADANFHEAIEHLGRTHLVMNSVCLAMHRQLASEHPLKVLLAPHTAMTLIINDTAKKNLVAMNGLVERIMGCFVETTLAALKIGMNSFKLMDAAPVKALAARGLADTDALPVYPYRDDALLVWPAIFDFVSDYVELYYESDADVVNDTELRAFMTEIGSKDGGRLTDVHPVNTVPELIEFIATCVFIGSCQHSAVNFAQFPFMGWAPHMPGAGWGPPATDEAEYLALMPPWDMNVLAADAVWQLSNLRDNILGKYPPLHFKDPRVAMLVTVFQNDLAEIEETIDEREKSRLLPYPFLIPSTIPNSIHI